MTKIILICNILFFLLFTHSVLAFENLSYTWRGYPNQIKEGELAVEDLSAHAQQIDIFSSEAYHIDQTGKVTGSLHPAMFKIARKTGIKIMPLVGNTDFDRVTAHHFLIDMDAQNRAIEALLQLCQTNHFYGVQIDFEGMSSTDKEAFSNFFMKISNALHKEGFKVSIAIIPALTEQNDTEYLMRRYKNWSGVYDYKILSKYSDFITLMTYDQHGELTTPGPVSGNLWDEAIVRYALQYIPHDKISLGIPLHSAYWYTGSSEANQHIHPISIDITYSKAKKILQENHGLLFWSQLDKTHYSIYNRHFLNEYLFFEDSASFKSKLALVKKYKLRGISSWCLGEEDERIWQYLPKRISQ
jgi:spore germination protein YaaH